jgi:hypothetical protein
MPRVSRWHERGDAYDTPHQPRKIAKTPPASRVDNEEYPRPRKNVTLLIKEMLARNPEIDLDDQMADLKEMGYELTVTTVGALRQDYFQTIRIATKFKHVKLVPPHEF